MKKILLIVAVLSLASCSLTNDQIIAEAEKCEAAGMEAKIYFNGFEEIRKISCIPKLNVPIKKEP